MLWAFVSFIGGAALFKSWQYFPWLTTVCSAGLFISLGLKNKDKNKRVIFLFIPLVLAGALYAAFRYQPPVSFGNVSFGNVSFGGARAIEASLTGYASFPARQRYGFSQSFRVTGDAPIKSVDPGARIRGLKELRIYTRRPLRPGRLYRVSARLSLPSPRLDPGVSGLPPTPRAQVIKSVCRGPAPWPERLRGRLDIYFAKNFPRQEAGLLMAVTTGERSRLSWRIRHSFSKCGLAHLISIAGLHFGIFSLAIFLSVMLLMRLLPLKWLERLSLLISPKQLAALASFPLLSGYLLLSGMRVPAVRAFIMISFFLLGVLIGRRRAWQTSLAFAAFLLVLWRPGVIFGLSFELSFLSVLLIGLFVFAPGEKDENNDGDEKNGRREAGEALFKKIKKYVLRLLLLSVTITAGLMPLVAYYFHRVQLISPAANLALLPVAGFLLVPVAVMSGFTYLATGWYPLPFLSGWLASVSIRMAGFFSSIPRVCPHAPAFPAGFLLVFYGFLAAWIYSGNKGQEGKNKNKNKKKNKKIYLALAVSPFVIWAGVGLSNAYLLKRQRLSITFLDDGTGETAVAQLPDGKTAVMDTGPNGRETSGYLEYMGKTRIDYLVLSNSRRCNTGGAAYLASRYKIGEIWYNGMFAPLGGGAPEKKKTDFFSGKKEKIPEERLSRGQYMEGREGTGSYRITVLHPYAGFFPLRESLPLAANNSSLVLRIEDRWGRSALLAGGIGRLAQEDLLRLGGLLHCDVYKAPYRSPGPSSWAPFISRVHPEIAVVTGAGSGPLGQGRGKTKQNTLRALADCGARVLSTGGDGAVKTVFDENGVHVKTWKDMELRRNPAGLPQELHNLKMLFSFW